MEKKENLNKNYPTWLVPIEIAKKLKEIGFNEPCLYYNSEAISGMGYQCIEIEERIHNEDPNVIELRELKYFNYNKTKGCTSIPAWEEVFKWFRERNLLGIIAFDIEYDSLFYYEIENEKGNTKGHIPAFNTYEEAREALVLDLIDTYRFIEEEKHCLISFYHNKKYGTGSLMVMQVGGEIKISDKEELQQIWETLKEDPKLYFEALFDTDYISYKSSKMFRFKEEKGKI